MIDQIYIYLCIDLELKKSKKKNKKKSSNSKRTKQHCIGNFTGLKSKVRKIFQFILYLAKKKK